MSDFRKIIDMLAIVAPTKYIDIDYDILGDKRERYLVFTLKFVYPLMIDELPNIKLFTGDFCAKNFDFGRVKPSDSITSCPDENEIISFRSPKDDIPGYGTGCLMGFHVWRNNEEWQLDVKSNEIGESVLIKRSDSKIDIWCTKQELYRVNSSIMDLAVSYDCGSSQYEYLDSLFRVFTNIHRITSLNEDWLS